MSMSRNLDLYSRLWKIKIKISNKWIKEKKVALPSTVFSLFLGEACLICLCACTVRSRFKLLQFGNRCSGNQNHEGFEIPGAFMKNHLILPTGTKIPRRKSATACKPRVFPVKLALYRMVLGQNMIKVIKTCLLDKYNKLIFESIVPLI